MKPWSFDPETAREAIGDTQSRAIEAKARADADAETFDPPKWSTETYWECVKGDMMAVIYAQQHKKRTDRNERKAAGPTSTEKGHP